MKIDEFRQKYPQYNDVSDTELAQRLHAKHYPDVDFNEFASRFGVATTAPAEVEQGGIRVGPEELPEGVIPGGIRVGPEEEPEAYELQSTIYRNLFNLSQIPDPKKLYTQLEAKRLREAAEIEPEASTAKQLLGGAIKGGMRLGQAAIELPQHTLWLAGNIMELGPEGAGARRTVQEIAEDENVEGLVNKYQEIIDQHALGREAILRNHPEWESEPPEDFLDLLTSPKKLGVAVAESVPILVGAGIVTGAGRPDIGFSMLYAVEGQGIADAGAAAGLSENEQEYLYHTYGPAAAAIEYFLRIKPGIKLGKRAYNRVLSRTAQKISQRGMPRTSGAWVELIQEMVEEPTQQALEEFATQGVTGEDIEGGVKGFIDRQAQAALIGGAAAFIPLAAGGFVGGTKRVANKLMLDKTGEQAAEYARAWTSGTLQDTVMKDGVSKAEPVKELPKDFERNELGLQARMDMLLKESQVEKDTDKLAKLADEMEQVDAEIESISEQNTATLSIKELHKLAKRQKIKVPKGTTKTGIRSLLRGPQEIVETESGWAVREELESGKKAWSIERYDSYEDARNALQLKQYGEAFGRGYGQTKPRVRVQGEIGKVEVAPVELVNEEGKVEVISPAETDQQLIEAVRQAKRISKKVRKPQIKKQKAKQAARAIEAYKKATGKDQISRVRARIIARGAMKVGEAAVPELENPPQLTDEQWEQYEERIDKTYPEDLVFTRDMASRALRKLREGYLPQGAELAALTDVIGVENAVALGEALQSKVEYSWADAPELILSFMKAFKFGWDVQAPRQFSQISGIKHPAFKHQIRYFNLGALFSKKFAYRTEGEIRSRDSYKLARRYKVPFLSLGPFKGHMGDPTRLPDYGSVTEFFMGLEGKKFAPIRWLGRRMSAFERGADVGINWGMLRLWEIQEQELSAYRGRRALKDNPLTADEIDKIRTNNAKNITALAKRFVGRGRRAKQLTHAASYILMSPGTTFGRPIATWHALTDVFRTGSVEQKTYAAQNIALNLAKYYAIGWLISLMAAKHREKNPDKSPPIDGSSHPLDSLFGKVRILNDVVDLSHGDAPQYRTLGRILFSGYARAKEKFTGKTISEIGDQRVRDVGEELMRYFKGRESLALGLAQTLATGKDWLGRDIGGLDATIRTLGMEPLVAIYEAAEADGLLESWENGDMGAIYKNVLSNAWILGATFSSLGVSSYPERATKTRQFFKDTIAERGYDKKWDELNLGQQHALQGQYQQQLGVLDEKVRQEKVKDGYNMEKLYDEGRAAGKLIRKGLNKSNAKKMKDIDISVTRQPKDFWLNDDRYNRYKELIIKNLNGQLNNINVEDFYNNTERVEVLRNLVRAAKDRSFGQLMAEIQE